MVLHHIRVKLTVGFNFVILQKSYDTLTKKRTVGTQLLNVYGNCRRDWLRRLFLMAPFFFIVCFYRKMLLMIQPGYQPSSVTSRKIHLWLKYQNAVYILSQCYLYCQLFTQIKWQPLSEIFMRLVVRETVYTPIQFINVHLFNVIIIININHQGN